MYVLLTDETNLQKSDDVKFFAYGGLFFRFELLPELDSAVRAIRSKYGFKSTDDLKFNTKERPPGIDQKTYTAAKSEVLDLCVEKDCRFIAYVVHHGIANGQSSDQRLTFASDHVLKGFHDFLSETKDTGVVLMDKLPIQKGDAYFREKFQIGLTYPKSGSSVTLDRIHLYGTTGIGMSHLASLIDIVLGSFRYCINNPQSPSVAGSLFKRVLHIMWHQELNGVKTVRERGLILRPSEIKASEYKDEYSELVESLKKYATN